MQLFRTALTSTIFLKASSLLIGFLLWSSVSELFPRTLWVVVPVCFYNKDNRIISAPEYVNIEISGKRAHIKRIDTRNLALHIDATSLQSGSNLLAITRELLYMPQSISILTTIPQKIMITVSERISS